MSLPCLPENYKIVEAIKPQVGAAIVGDYVSLKNVHMAFVIVQVGQGNAAQMVITLERATAVAPSGSVAIGTAVPIWANLDTAASDTLARATDAVGYTLDVGVKNKIVVFQVDPATLGAGYACLTVKTAASHAVNLTSAMYLLYERYQAATPPAAITD